MNYIVDEKSYKTLLLWGSENPNLFNTKIVFSNFYEDKSHITLHKMLNGEKNIEAYIKICSNKIKFELKSDKKQMFKFYVSQPQSEDTENDFLITLQNATDIIYDGIKIPVEIIARTYLLINRFMLSGNVVEFEKRKISGQKHDGTIAFKPFNGEVYAINLDYVRKSPDNVFAVRGHPRRYKKSGRVIWIDSYLKGIKKDK